MTSFGNGQLPYVQNTTERQSMQWTSFAEFSCMSKMCYKLPHCLHQDINVRLKGCDLSKFTVIKMNCGYKSKTHGEIFGVSIIRQC